MHRRHPHASWLTQRARVGATSLQAPKLREAIGNAVYTYRSYRDSFRAIQARSMGQDLSWDNAASIYEEVMVAAKYQW